MWGGEERGERKRRESGVWVYLVQRECSGGDGGSGDEMGLLLLLLLLLVVVVVVVVSDGLLRTKQRKTMMY